MKPRMLQLLVFVLLVGTWGFAEAEEHRNHGLEPLKLYDNFEQALINSDKWVGNQFEVPFRFNSSFLEVVRKTTPEEHHLRILNRSFGLTFSNGGNTLNLFRLAFTRPDTITAIRSRVQVQNVESTGCPTEPHSTPTRASAQIFGFFFNTGTPSYHDVIAGVGVRRPSDSPLPPDVLEIFYFVNECTDSDCANDKSLIPEGDGSSLGKVKTGEWVTLLVQWDKKQHRFIFQRETQRPKFVTYTVSDTELSGGPKTLRADNFIANCNGFGKPVGMVDALFDNVFVNESALP